MYSISTLYSVSLMMRLAYFYEAEKIKNYFFT
jgi:hypothetical protein